MDLATVRVGQCKVADGVCGLPLLHCHVCESFLCLPSVSVECMCVHQNQSEQLGPHYKGTAAPLRGFHGLSTPLVGICMLWVDANGSCKVCNGLHVVTLHGIGAASPNKRINGSRNAVNHSVDERGVSMEGEGEAKRGTDRLQAPVVTHLVK